MLVLNQTFTPETHKPICSHPVILNKKEWLQEVATFTASCEKYVGTESGGMDQAISIMGQQGIAKLVEFNPVLPHTATCGLGFRHAGAAPKALRLSQARDVQQPGCARCY